MNDKRSPIIEDIFDDGYLTKKGREILINKSRGYVSYVRGERKNTFPTRLYPPNIITKKEYPTKNILNQE